MDSINEETKAAIKLSRADAVKLVAVEMTALAALDVEACNTRVSECRARFRSWAVLCAVNSTNGGLDAAMHMVGSGTVPIHGQCLHQLHMDESDGGNTTSVVFSDSPKTYDARFRAVIDIDILGEGEELRDAWATALADLKAAKERDQRITAMKKEAREVLIKAALDSSDEGATVVAAIRKLSASLKNKS